MDPTIHGAVPPARAMLAVREWRLEPVRILLVDLAPMLEQVVQEIVAGEPGLEIAGAPRRGESVVQAAQRLSATVVLTTAEPPPAVVVDQLIERPSRVRVLALRRNGLESQLWTLSSARRELGELSPRRLVAAIRDAPHVEPAPANERH